MLEGDTVVLLASKAGRPTDTIPSSWLEWSSSNPSVATADSNGTIRTRSIGYATIRARSGDYVAEAGIAVVPTVLIGAGDIADCNSSGDEATALILDSLQGLVYTAGDNAYPTGSALDFSNCYEPTWGRHRARTRPAVGNHEYMTPGAGPYFSYFGKAAGDSGAGYYSYDRGAWHIVVLNSLQDVRPGSPQEQWLRADLLAHPSKCALAYFHYPLFSSGPHGSISSMKPLWDALYDANADVIISAHDHVYERFAPQNPEGAADGLRGIREFVVGTGGRSLYAFSDIQANSEVRSNTTYGVLKLTLHLSSYDWEFIPVRGGAFTDYGHTACH